MLGLLEKNGLICREVARELISLAPGSRLKTTSEYARLLRAGQGTVQKAFKTLEGMGAIILESRGHLGTYLLEKDLRRLWAVSGLGTVTGVMPLPDSGEFEGIATALTQLFKDAGIPLNLLHLNGARRRIEYLRSGADFVVLSRFSAERVCSQEPDLKVLLGCGANTFYTADSLTVLVRREAEGAIRRVGIDETSWDHAEITRLEFDQAPVEFVLSPYHMIPDLILEGTLDAAVWRRTTRRVEAASQTLSFLPLRSDSARRISRDLSALAVVGAKDNAATGSLFAEVVDERGLVRVRDEVIEGKRVPLF